FKAEDISECLYKICDDSVKPRHFLSADNTDEIEAILSDCEDHFLHEFIDGDESLWPIIDFDLSREMHDGIEPKLIRKEILDILN
ncbi:517_t:CDS:1, partial [Funneliformis geosporum]